MSLDLNDPGTVAWANDAIEGTRWTAALGGKFHLTTEHANGVHRFACGRVFYLTRGTSVRSPTVRSQALCKACLRKALK